jgi:outer membrane lipoprotein-sorting protein
VAGALALLALIAAGAVIAQVVVRRGASPSAHPAPIAALPGFPAIQDLQMTLVIFPTERGGGRREETRVTYRRPDQYRLVDSTGNFVTIRQGASAVRYITSPDYPAERIFVQAGALCGLEPAILSLGILEHMPADFFVLGSEKASTGRRYHLAPRSLAGIRLAGTAGAEVHLLLDGAGLPSRLEVTEGAGKLFRKWEFRNVALNRGVGDEAFQPPTVPPNAPSTILPRPAQVPPVAGVGALADVARRVPFRVWSATRPPAGFAPKPEARFTILPSPLARGGPVQAFVNSDWVDANGCKVTLNQDNLVRPGSSSQGEVRLPDGSQARLSGYGYTVALSWDREGTSLSLNGPVSIDELVAMAGSLR